MKYIIYITDYESWLKLWNLIKTDPEYLLKYMTFIGNSISLISVLIGITAVVIAFLNYKSLQKWEKTKLIVKLIEEFDKDTSVKSVRKILDYNDIDLIDTSTLPPLNEILTTFHFNRVDNHLVDALTTRTTEDYRIKPEIQFIRDDFDVYFNKMSIFQIFIDNGKVDKKLVYDYFKYDVECMNFSGIGDNEGRNNEQVLKFAKNFHNNAYKLIEDIHKSCTSKNT